MDSTLDPGGEQLLDVLPALGAFVEEVLIETEEEIDVFFLKIEDDGEWSSIEDDDEFEKVSAVFEEMTSA